QFAVVGTVISAADFPNPASHAERQAIYAHTIGIGSLAERHRKAWDELWQSDIIIEGDPALQRQVTMALYSICSSILPGSRQSIAPMGLTSDHYGGHIFWDADTWMLPVLCILHPEAARDMVDYRADRLPQARANALAMGYRGAMYPWESDLRGNEATPTFALTGPLEHHVTADVARGAWLYFLTSADTVWLRESAEPMIRACADFWVSRAEANPDNTYSIRGVVGADEYAIYVDDNAFTNAAAIRNLQYAAKAAKITGRPIDKRWQEVADGLSLHHLPSGVIAEYEGFADTTIKQADVALLAYPLDFITDRNETDRTLTYYEALTDTIGGPAMSHSAMAVNYARLNQPEKAARLIDRATTPYLRGEHLMMAETPSTDDTYFLTGAGGLLQAILMGYLGIDITEGGVSQSSASLPSGIRKITAITPHGTFSRSGNAGL
ncbi:MAG: glycoside hydrolase family 65 protein, partial [Paramuribaculum sp.]|nr:glycoside hydrolase family 65 protein [Paramuribaculum sp.]